MGIYLNITGGIYLIFVEKIGSWLKNLSFVANNTLDALESHKPEHMKYDLVDIKNRDKVWGSYSGAAGHLREAAAEQGVQVNIRRGKTVYHYRYLD